MGPVEASGTYGIGTVTITGDASDPRGRDSQIADNAIAFMLQHRDVPFYVNVWCHSTHYQVDPPEQFVAEFASLKVKYEDFPPHGEDVSDLWQGQMRARRTPLMWKRSVARSELAIRDGDWKLWVEHGASSRLYDLRKDPAETIDVAAAHPDVVKRLAQRVDAWNRTLPKSYEKSAGKEEQE